MKIALHALVYRRLCEVAESQGRTKKSVIQEALVRMLGLEGIPITDDDAYGEAAPVPAGADAPGPATMAAPPASRSPLRLDGLPAVAGR